MGYAKKIKTIKAKVSIQNDNKNNIITVSDKKCHGQLGQKLLTAFTKGVSVSITTDLACSSLCVGSTLLTMSPIMSTKELTLSKAER